VEDSLAARLCVLAATTVASIAVTLTSGVVFTSLACLGAVVAGHTVSWRWRARPRRARGQVLLGGLLLGAVAYLFADLFLGVFGGALPQAKFALVALAITAFDLKSRRNLYTHLWHSLVILYVAALFAWDATFLPFVLAWGGCLFGFLLATSAGGTAVRGPLIRRSEPLIRLSGPLIRRSGPWLLAWMALGALAFVALPRFAGRPLAVPLLVSVPLDQQNPAEVLPAVLPLVGTAPQTGAEGEINLRIRGRLGDEVVMRVRAPAASYWRAYVLEEYRTQSWARLSHRAGSLPPVATHIQVADENTDQGPSLPQTFYIQRPLAVDVPLSYPVRELYFPARQLTLVETGTVRSPYSLRPGVTYAAVSQVRDTSATRLRQAAPVDTGSYAVDLALPASLPARVRRLADTLVAGRTTEYDRVTAIADHLRAGYRYSLDTPRLPAGADAVDRFLFVDRVGFCEQFASALAVLLRTQGIPTRLVVGYAQGDHDQLTSSFTVHARDAHAWVEVLFPGTGWVPFDASPGFVAEPVAHQPGRWFLSDFSPQVAFAGVAGAVGGSLRVLAALAVVAVAAAGLTIRRRRLRVAPELRAYARAQRLLRVARLPARAAAETPDEHLARVAIASPGAAGALRPLAGAALAHAYAGSGPGGLTIIPLVLALCRHAIGREPR
ncbi:MAG TPA: transglutaminaseTgpA domain-containing protein, partial [Candidatus Dormibacteraeota bacterium]|nr:transglutaminaseTgpA domain-containing protein [Candidatus Dormibacteraeota bacterium]